MAALPTFDPGYSTPELTEIFSAQATVAAILEFEAGLALAMGDTGMAPTQAVAELAEACSVEVESPEDILDATWSVGTPINALRDRVTSGLDADVGQWFHHGATTQDAVDTGLMLQAHRALGVMDGLLVDLATRLHHLAVEHRHQPHMGRSFLQLARPTTFGLRVAGWLDAVLGHIGDLRERHGGLCVQLGGSVGTLADYGDLGDDVVGSLARRLGLSSPRITWHADRTPVLALAQALLRVSRTMAKMAADIALLSSSDVGELSVRSGASSSMPGKENPIDSIRAIAAAAACNGAVAMLTGSAPPELDRGVGGWHIERVAVPLAFQSTGAAVTAMLTSTESLEVDTSRMSAAVGSRKEGADNGQIERVLERFALVVSGASSD